MIPLALAMRISQHTGLKLVNSVFLLNSREGNAMIQRMFFHPEYAGEVPQGQFLLIDDVFTTGITLMGLKHHIENSGSRVVAASAIGSSKHGMEFEAPNLQFRMLKAKFPEIEKYFELELLTKAQVEYLLKFNSLNNFFTKRYYQVQERLMFS